jgi:hypothetical protein
MMPLNVLSKSKAFKKIIAIERIVFNRELDVKSATIKKGGFK